MNQKDFFAIRISMICFIFLGCNGPNAPVIHQDSIEQASPGKQSTESLSFENGASQIFTNRCSKCHSAGGVLPNWNDYATAYSKKDRIYQRIVLDKTMPPPGMGTITDDERATIGRWIQAGAPQKSAQNSSPQPPASPVGPKGPEPIPPISPVIPVGAPDYSSIQNALLQCTACHTKDSNSSLPIFPVLAGQQANYLENELLAFRSKIRHDKNAVDFMQGPASQLDDQSIHLLAQYFSNTKESTSSKPTNSPQIAAGKEIFEKGAPENGVPACVGCHGQNAEGSAIAPRLAGQHTAYLLNQFAAFREGSREEAKMMPNISKDLTPQQQESLASYLESIRQ